MNHIPMFIERDQHKNWPLLQVEATCNVEPGTFNDWFTGNFFYFYLFISLFADVLLRPSELPSRAPFISHYAATQLQKNSPIR